MSKYFQLVVFIFVTATVLNAQQGTELDWDALQKTKPWHKTEVWDPIPEKVTPGLFSSAPSDAIVLFDGHDLSAWQTPKFSYGARMDQVQAILNEKINNPEFSDPQWTVKDGAMIVNPGTGALETKQAFGDVQLHLEWLSPVDPGKKDQGYSNSGVFLMGLYEVQILNSYENKTYPNGQAGALYKQAIPMVNASRPPGEWQTYDIIFNAPKFSAEGTLESSATITVIHNGVLIQNNFELKGPCVYIGEPYYIAHPAKLPLLLQDHGDKVRFRNIWIREL